MNNDNVYIDLARQIILKELNESEYAVFLFGSRTQKSHSQTADIDIGILGHQPLSIQMRAHLLECLNESDIPFKVDVVDFFNADPEFKRQALKKTIIWNQPNSITLD
jgi:uncharacterized protein